MTIHQITEGTKTISMYDPAVRTAASADAEIRGQRRGYGKFKPTSEVVTVFVSTGNLWERHPAHEQAGHKRGEVMVGPGSVVTVALTPLIAERLEAKTLSLATPHQIERHEQQMKAQETAAVARFKERCREDYIRLCGSDEGFEAAFPSIRAQKVIDTRKELAFNIGVA